MSICSGRLAGATVLFCFASGKINVEKLFVEMREEKNPFGLHIARMKIKSCFAFFGNDFFALD